MKASTFKIIKGNNPVLFTAPHAVKHKRPQLSTPIKVAEPWTDYIAENLALATGGFALINTKENALDPNFYPEAKNPFKQMIREIHEKYKIRYVIDIHGLSDRYSYDLGIYWLRGYRKSLNLAYDLAGCLNQGELRDLMISFLNFVFWNKQETIGEFSTATLGIPSVQLEIARYIREEDSLREEFIKNITAYFS